MDELISDEDEPFTGKLYDAFANRVEDDFEKDFQGLFVQLLFTLSFCQQYILCITFLTWTMDIAGVFSTETTDIFQQSFTPISPDENEVYQTEAVKRKRIKYVKKIHKRSEEDLSEGEVRIRPIGGKMDPF